MVEVVAKALLHFLWQGGVIGLGLALALRVMTRSSARLRYAVACLALVMMAAAPLLTIVQLNRAPEFAEQRIVQAEPVPVLSGEISASTQASQTAKQIETANEKSFEPTKLLVGVWALGVLLLASRLLGNWIWVGWLAKRESAQVPAWLQEKSRVLAARIRVRKKFRIFQTNRVTSPMVIGWAKPVILIPMSALTQLSPEQLEAILAHELAHIRRHDYLINLMQSAVETVLFYHPGVWWVCRQIRIEREHCCDDVAVAVCGSPVVYAGALLKLECARSAPQLALAANDGDLKSRIQRVVGLPLAQTRSGGLAGVVVAGALAVLAVFALSAEPTEAQANRPDATLLFADYKDLSATKIAAIGDGPWRRKSEGNSVTIDYFGWSLHVEAVGRLLFDESTVAWMAAGSSLTIEHTDATGATRRVVFHGEKAGVPQSRFSYRPAAESSWQSARATSDVQGWFAQFAPHLVAAGLDVEARALAKFEENGTEGLFAYLQELNSGSGRATAIAVVVSEIDLSTRQWEDVTAATSELIGSDGTKADLFLKFAAAAGIEGTLPSWYRTSLRSLQSDGTKKNLYLDLTRDQFISGDVALQLGAEDIRSDGTLASLVLALAAESGNRLSDQAMAKALVSIGSDGTLSETLIKLVELEIMPPETALTLATDNIGSRGSFEDFVARLASESN